MIAGPVSERAVAAAEETLGLAFPPSYRAFLRALGGLTLPPRQATVHAFVGIDPAAAAEPADDDKGVVQRTLHARVENHLGEGYVIVGLGAEPGEWYCLDTSQAGADGECPIVLFDARDNTLDQQFYDGFGAMIREVMTFVEEMLDEELAPDDRPASEAAWA